MSNYDIIRNFKLAFPSGEDYINAINELGVQKDSIFVSLRILLRTQSHLFKSAYLGCKPGNSVEQIQCRLKRSTFRNAISELSITFLEFDTQQMKLDAIKNHLITSDKIYHIKSISKQKEIQLKKDEQKKYDDLKFEKRMRIYPEFILMHNIDNTEENYETFLSYGDPSYKAEYDELLIEDHSDNDCGEPEADYASCLSCGSNFGCICVGGN
jgi:hypothetical protein